MGEISPLAESCQQMLSDKGRLSTAIVGFVARKSQSDLAMAIAQAIEDKTMLVAEAGTGTGKTFAYLLPSLLSGKKTLISTATKTLQDQLFQKDLPMLVRALGISVQMHNLKGRSNYICQYRVALHVQEGQFQSPQCVDEIVQIQSKLSQMKTGERAELVEIGEDSPVWPYVTSTADNCLGTQCPNHETCFLIKSRKRALSADIVVINHHLFFADSHLKQEGFGELLPGMEVIIFDEAHQLAEIATHFNGQRIGTRQFKDLLQDIIKEWPTLDLANQPLKRLSHQIDVLMDELCNSMPAVEDRLSWETIRHSKAFMTAWERWLAINCELKPCFDENNNAEFPALARCKERLDAFEKILISFTQVNSDKIRWLERFKQNLVFHSTPFDIGKEFRSLLQPQQCTYIFTSATLTFASTFDSFCKPLGLKAANTLLLSSPFDFEKQSLLYLPRGLPDPKDATYYECLVMRAIPIIKACGGRCFFLFTSHKALRQVAYLLGHAFEFPLLIQGDEAKPILLARFKQLGNAVLLGTSTFWEGVDVKGDCLSCVIIDKIPFANPFDPVMQGKMAHLKNQGLSGFDELSLPNAVISLKQGVGRLIRDITDKGLLMIADPRLTCRAYGRQILASLPKIPKTRDEQKALKFISELNLHDEPIGN
ncbi:MAG: ATP-dependent DNA helicase [Legionella sp.]|nr:ATP-dependent DNA helicase [Legionella sp.]